MEGAEARKVDHGLCVPLARPLRGAHAAAIRRYVRALLDWQVSLEGWPSPVAVPDATPFVTIYADGVLRGCFGSHEGGPCERLTRAFLRALEDSRYGTVRPEERHGLAVAVSYVTSVRPIEAEQVHEQLAAGPEGLGLTVRGRPPVVLLPGVSRDERAGPRALLALLAKKCGVSDWRDAQLFAIRTEDVIVRAGDDTPHAAEVDLRDQAARWLARLVDARGAIAFGIDARRRRRITTGLMHHGRSAQVIKSLREHGGHARAERRARAWLGEQIARGLAGKPLEGWPQDAAMVAGTLALAQMAGVEVERALGEAARAEELRRSPWHAAQVAAAMGRRTPEPLWRACVDDLAREPWAPWTLIAARARGDGDVVASTSRVLAESIRRVAPYEGGCSGPEVPETAVTALVVEALEGLAGADAREAVLRGRAFLRCLLLVGDHIPPSLDADLARGGFAASPVVVDLLRCDVAGHAFSALGAHSASWNGDARGRAAQRSWSLGRGRSS
jgi:AMMECR1 domain-containing protein